MDRRVIVLLALAIVLPTSARANQLPAPSFAPGLLATASAVLRGEDVETEGDSDTDGEMAHPLMVTEELVTEPAEDVETMEPPAEGEELPADVAEPATDPAVPDGDAEGPPGDAVPPPPPLIVPPIEPAEPPVLPPSLPPPAEVTPTRR